jgi:hypothetical protein
MGGVQRAAHVLRYRMYLSIWEIGMAFFSYVFCFGLLSRSYLSTCVIGRNPDWVKGVSSVES